MICERNDRNNNKMGCDKVGCPTHIKCDASIKPDDNTLPLRRPQPQSQPNDIVAVSSSDYKIPLVIGCIGVGLVVLMVLNRKK